MDTQLKNEKILNEAISKALAEIDPDRSINAFLSIIGGHTHSDRAYIFEDLQNGFDSNTYEWCREGVHAEKDTLQSVPHELLDKSWYRTFRLQQNILITDLDEYHEKAPALYDILAPQAIHSLVAGPIRLEEHILGFVGIDNPPVSMIESGSALIQMISSFCAVLLRHRDNVRRLQQLSLQDQLTGILNRNGYYHYVNAFDPQKGAGILFCDLDGLKQMIE